MKDINIIVKYEIQIEESTLDDIMDIGAKITNVNYDINVISAQATKDMMSELKELEVIEIVNLDEPATFI